MPTKKTKKTTKARDLKPRRDTKAGGVHGLRDLTPRSDARAGSGRNLSHTLSSSKLSSPNAINR
jgi:hypothetical protein